MVSAASPPDSFEVVGLIGSIVGVVLAAFAIWQAWTLYRWSQRAQKEAEAAAMQIAGSVTKLEDVFDRFYRDTFAIVRETVSDMRRHVWGAEPAGERATKSSVQNYEQIRDEIRLQLNQLVADRTADRTQVAELQRQVGELLSRAFDTSPHGAGETESSRTSRLDERSVAFTVRVLARGANAVSLPEIAAASGLRPGAVFLALKKLEAAGAVERLSDKEHMPPRPLFRLTAEGTEMAAT